MSIHAGAFEGPQNQREAQGNPERIGVSNEEKLNVVRQGVQGILEVLGSEKKHERLRFMVARLGFFAEAILKGREHHHYAQRASANYKKIHDQLMAKNGLWQLLDAENLQEKSRGIALIEPITCLLTSIHDVIFEVRVAVDGAISRIMEEDDKGGMDFSVEVEFGDNVTEGSSPEPHSKKLKLHPWEFKKFRRPHHAQPTISPS